MKTKTMSRYNYYSAHRNSPVKYPNSATFRDIRDRIVDALLAAAISFGLISVVLFLLVL